MKLTRFLALLVVPMCGLCSVVCAPALGHEYRAFKTSVTATGEHSVFTVDEVITSCKKYELKFVGLVGPAAVIPLTPVYKECQVLGDVALVKAEKKAQFELETPLEVKKEEFKLPTALIGESGASIKINATIEGEPCEIAIPKQTFAGDPTTFLDTGVESGEVHMKIEGMHFTSNNKCAGLVPKEGSNLKYEGNASENGLIAE